MSENIKMTIKAKAKIEKINNCWVCPYCKKDFGNRKGNLRSHLQYIEKNLTLKKKVCINDITQINIDTLKEQIKSLEAKPRNKIKIKKKNNRNAPNLIHSIEDVEITTKKIDENWKYNDLKTICYQLIKACYLSDHRWKDNCIVTWGEYYKIKNGGLWSNEMVVESNGENKQFKITKSFLCRYLFSKMLRYLANSHKDLLKEKLQDVENKNFYICYMKLNKRAPLTEQKILHRCFLKRQRNKTKKVLETKIVEFSSDSDEDIEIRPPTPEPKYGIATKKDRIWLKKYKENEYNEELNKTIQYIKEAIEENRWDRVTSRFQDLGRHYSYEKGNERKEFVLSKLPDSELKRKLIVYFEEWRREDEY